MFFLIGPLPKSLSRGEGLGLLLFSSNFSCKNHVASCNLAPSPRERAGERSKLNGIASHISIKVAPHDNPTPKPTNKTLSPFFTTFSFSALQSAIGIVDETVFPVYRRLL
jgi:hypothetical protein